MKTHFLFPRQFKKIGWLIFVPALLAGIAMTVTNFDSGGHFKMKVFALFNSDILSSPQFAAVIENGISDEIVISMLIVGGLLIGFSKLKIEDEYTAKIRYESLVWAVYFNCAVMLFATLFVYGLYYFQVMIANMFTLLFFFIVRFHVMLYRLNKSAENEE